MRDRRSKLFAAGAALVALAAFVAPVDRTFGLVLFGAGAVVLLISHVLPVIP